MQILNSSIPPRYFRTAVGSFLHGLDESERNDIYLILFIAQTDPTLHPAWSEGWMEKVADKVIAYGPEEQWKHLQELERNKELREKALFDYTYLLKECNKVRAKYIAMIEDDVIAMDGWYHRTRQALAQAEEQTKRSTKDSFLYLRLFYTEQFLGFNSEGWLTYLVASVAAVTVEMLLLLAIRLRFPKYGGFLTYQIIFLVCGICTPPFITLFFLAGRVSMLPLSTGVAPMPNYGCCSQGLVFPQTRISDVVGWYESKKIGYVDVLTEEYGMARDELRYAVTPSVLQHIGRKSSKGNDYGKALRYSMSVAGRLWNFAFETNTGEDLHSEHLRHIKKSHG
ncbi:integral membrane protein [Glonium stellatum]|uniref:Integral membrane protein n=1 Tax=Glonium stellatum TaxID=574774 RepID=A0A8E2JVW3_9PEZI|nr:integral membrane protein [Glonium stellatum]